MSKDEFVVDLSNPAPSPIEREYNFLILDLLLSSGRALKHIEAVFDKCESKAGREIIADLYDAVQKELIPKHVTGDVARKLSAERIRLKLDNETFAAFDR